MKRIGQLAALASIVPLFVVAFASALAAASAETSAQRSSQQRGVYIPRHGKRCKPGYRKRRLRISGHRVRACVKRRRVKRRRGGTSRPQKSLKLYAHLSSSKRDPLNPFKVTYDYSASATLEAAGGEAEEPAPLPAGVLALYRDGLLECAVNVVGEATVNECPVTYAALGEHRVTTIYTSGEKSATTTEIQQIEPLATTTTLSVSYEDLPPKEELFRESIGGEEYVAWQVGALKISGQAQPSGTPFLTCSGAQGTGCIETGLGTLSGVLEAPVFARVNHWNAANQPVFAFNIPYKGSGDQKQWLSEADLTAGTYYLRAVHSARAGYLPSEALSPINLKANSLPGFLRVMEPSVTADGEFAPLASLGSYTKRGASTNLKIRAELETASLEDCFFQLRVNGAAGYLDPGTQVTTSTGAATRIEHSFEGLGSGPVGIEIWTRYAGPEPNAICGLHEALLVISEEGA